jgi:2'-deoxynucleoside 5'-phosphate N-hydrolase
MKIYFTASGRGSETFKNSFESIFQTVEDLGHTNIDDLVFTIDKDEFYKGTHIEQVKLYKKAIELLKKCDVVVLEVTVHSLSMGFVMQKALEIGKPVIALYQENNEPYFALSVDNEKLQVIEYTSANLKKVLHDALNYAHEQMDTRFNFFISPRIGNYLDWVAKKKRIPRAVYLRNLIEIDIKKNEKFFGKEVK